MVSTSQTGGHALIIEEGNVAIGFRWGVENVFHLSIEGKKRLEFFGGTAWDVVDEDPVVASGAGRSRARAGRARRRTKTAASRMLVFRLHQIDFLASNSLTSHRQRGVHTVYILESHKTNLAGFRTVGYEDIGDLAVL